MATRLETVSPSHCESGGKRADDHPLAALTDGIDGRPMKSDSSSDDERHTKTGSNTSLQNNMSPSSQSQKRPMNAFLIFCKRHRSVVRQKYPHLENRSITKILGEWWAALDSDQKLKYTELARQYKEAFMKANPHFKWYKTTDLRPPTAPPSPPPPPVAPTFMTQNNIRPPAQPNQTQSTPKPPKKRYLENLENGEFRAANHVNHNAMANASTNGGPLSGGASSAAKCTNAGPPILDIETANRVIENALSGCLSLNSGPNANANREQSAFNSDIINGHINHVLEQHSIETRELEALERSSQRSQAFDDLRASVGNGSATHANHANHATHSTSVDKSATNSISTNPVLRSPHTPSDEDEPEEDNSADEEKPLNLSASTVLHTSNQHIIDHFIDKLLSTPIEGSTLSSSTALSLPFSSPSLSMMSSSDDKTKAINSVIHNNVRNVNNNRNNSNNHTNSDNTNTNCNTLSTSTGPHNSSASSGSRAAQSRKERSCKGKRYLEILSENKMGKRSRTVSSMSANSADGKDETTASAKNQSSKEQSSAGASGNGPSKWVSGGFDLEEHIKQLPQLGDTHLLNALSHSKANKTISSSGCPKSGSNDESDTNPTKPQTINNCCVVSNESNHNSMSDRSNSDIEDNDTNVVKNVMNNDDNNGDSDQLNRNNTLKHYTTDANVSKTSETVVNCVDNKAAGDESSAVCETQNGDSSDQMATDEALVKHKTGDDSVVANDKNTSDLVNNSLPTTQGIEFSDGLAALAEVALQQQRNSV